MYSAEASVLGWLREVHAAMLLGFEQLHFAAPCTQRRLCRRLHQHAVLLRTSMWVRPRIGITMHWQLLVCCSNQAGRIGGRRRGAFTCFGTDCCMLWPGGGGCARCMCVYTRVHVACDACTPRQRYTPQPQCVPFASFSLLIWHAVASRRHRGAVTAFVACVTAVTAQHGQPSTHHGLLG